MKPVRTLIVAAMTGLTLVATGCAVVRGQQSVSLNGFAKNTAERTRAEQIARGVNGVRSVRNNLVVR